MCPDAPVGVSVPVVFISTPLPLLLNCTGLTVDPDNVLTEKRVAPGNTALALGSVIVNAALLPVVINHCQI
jgi:hypothetical protein